MKKIFLHIVFLFVLIPVSKPQGCFNVDPTELKGCVPHTINVDNCEPTSPDAQTLYDYGDGTPLTSSPTHTYHSPGLYTVKQQAFCTGGCPMFVKTNYIEVLPSRKPSYNLDLCSGNDVTLTITDNIDTWVVSFEGVPTGVYSASTPIPFTYPDGSLKSISITPRYTSCQAEGFSFYPITSVVKPDVNSLTVNSQNTTTGQITLNFNARPEQRYIVQQSINNNSSWISLDTLRNLSGAQSVAFNNLNTAANQYCYRLIAYDDCGAQLISEEVCSVINTVGPPANNQNNVSWTNHIGSSTVSNYTVYRDNAAAPITTTSGTTYADMAVSCGVNYCYQVVTNLAQTNLAGSPIQSISASQCLTATSTTIPATITELNSTVNGSSVQLTWTTPAATVTEYQIARSVNGAAFVPYVNNTAPLSNTYTDNGTGIPPNEYCYRVTYKDVCGNYSLPVSTTCPMVLEVLTDNSTTLTNYLSWSTYSGASVASYIVQKLDENNTVISSINVGSATNYTDVIPSNSVKVVKYRIQVVPGIPTSQVPYSNIYEIKFEGEIYLPNAFTPNADGTNDKFMAKGKFLKEFKLTIFNRWGEVVYSTTELDQGWDGMYQGIQALPDAYAYLVEATDFWDKKITKRGSVTLLK